MSASLLRGVNVQIRDVSAGGCLLETDAYLPVGTIGVLELTLDGNRRVEWFRICRLHNHVARTYVAGAEFLPLTVAGESSVRSTVRIWPSPAAPGVAGPTRSLSSDPGNSVAFRQLGRSATVPVRATLSKQVLEFPSQRAHSEIGSAVAESTTADAPRLGKSDKGDVHMKKAIQRFIRDDQGQDLIEYVLIGSFVSIGALLGATQLGIELNGWYDAVGVWVNTQAGSVGGAP